MMTTYELTATDRHFAAFITREAGDVPSWFGVIVSLASNSVGNGNICLNLTALAGKDILLDGTELRLPHLETVRAALAASSVVGIPGEFKPLVLDGDGRLYLYRYWQYEADLERIIQEKARAEVITLDEALLGTGVQRYFPDSTEGETNWQKIAALAAVRKKFCVISGGPGTGKTSTVVKILALLLEQAGDNNLRIALAAPTGKAAARLKESIRFMKSSLSCSALLKERIPEEVTTIHRLLGVRAGSVRFRHSGDNLLPHDVVIIDEASMVALPLMAKLVVALKSDARFILLGDRDQLASVEAGAVLGDICGGGRQEPFSRKFAEFVARLTGDILPVGGATTDECVLADSLVVLKKNYRFNTDSSIGAVARAVNGGEGKRALELLRNEQSVGIRWLDIPKPDKLKKALAATIIAEYGPYLAAGTAAEALKLFDNFRILTALRQGPSGVAGLNVLVEEILAEKGLIDQYNRWYSGRPVMVTVNDYHLKLFNGDIGIVFPDPEYEGNPRVWFPSPEGGIRSVSPVRLPSHETVYAMTVHKSQGSEFGRVLMILPERDSEALARELIYTGITRAKNEVDVWADRDVFLGAVSRRIDRKSGLNDALWG